LTIYEEIEAELVRATKKNDKFYTPHEGYAVILEEMDELWDEIKKKNPNRLQMKSEAIQIAAMALRFVMDICF
jgi:NTP pyrophosphatase (non-canonical NTP hydrolase)